MPLNRSLLDDFNKHYSNLNICGQAKKITQDWLILHGEADQTVPSTQGMELHHQNPKSILKIIPDTDHVFGAKHPWMGRELPDSLKLACDITVSFFENK